MKKKNNNPGKENNNNNNNEREGENGIKMRREIIGRLVFL